MASMESGAGGVIYGKALDSAAKEACSVLRLHSTSSPFEELARIVTR